MAFIGAFIGAMTGRRRSFVSMAERRSWWIAGLLSIGAHLLFAGFLLFMVRSRPASPAANPVGTVELLMVEKKGSGKPSAGGRPQTQTPPSPRPPLPQPKPAVAEKTAAAAPAPPLPSPPLPPPLLPPPPPPELSGEPMPPAAAAAPTAAAAAKPNAEATAQPKAAAPQKPEALVFNLDGTDSESNAIVLGGHVIPASPDDRFRNRPPIYPYDAAIRGDHGAVVLIIHVNEEGAATGADIAKTSGVASLDQAALDAVLKWRFRPALKDGRAVPFDMPMRFIFDSG